MNDNGLGINAKGAVDFQPLWLHAVSEILLPALSLTFGLQIFRFLVPGLAWTFSDRLGVDIPLMGLLALLIFSFPFLSGGLRRWLGRGKAIVVATGGLGLLRLLMQFPWPDPLVDLGLAAAGAIFFGVFLSVYLDIVRSQGRPAIDNFALGLLVGLILDTVIHGAFGTYDIAWQARASALLIIIVLVLAQWSLLVLGKNTYLSVLEGNRTPRGKTWPWLAIGPFLFLQVVVFQNIARFAASSGWVLPQAFGLVLLSQVIGFAVALYILKKDWRHSWMVALTAGLLLLWVTLFPYPDALWQNTLSVILGQLALSLLLVLMLSGLGKQKGESTRQSYSTLANGLGMVIFVLFLFGYYAIYQMNLGYTNTILELAAGLVIAICVVFSVGLMKERVSTRNVSWLLLLPVTLLLLVPLINIVSWQEPEESTGEGFPLSIMTYNLHNGFNTKGDLDMEALARIIEENNPDIVALQEISRGWVISGRLDMLGWLSRRLNMGYVSGPTADPLWGNAILSRYPIVEYSSSDLPPRSLPLLRGLLSASIDIGNGERLNVIATHLHHIESDSEVRQLQVPVITDFWDDAPRTVILGDLNAEPDALEIEMLRVAGLSDTMPGAKAPGFTYHSADLLRRIDYIWLSPDLNVQSYTSPYSQASDHLPVLALIYR